jgi:hypothetical protein
MLKVPCVCLPLKIAHTLVCKTWVRVCFIGPLVGLSPISCNYCACSACRSVCMCCVATYASGHATGTLPFCVLTSTALYSLTQASKHVVAGIPMSFAVLSIHSSNIRKPKPLVCIHVRLTARAARHGAALPATSTMLPNKRRCAKHCLRRTQIMRPTAPPLWTTTLLSGKRSR